MKRCYIQQIEEIIGESNGVFYQTGKYIQVGAKSKTYNNERDAIDAKKKELGVDDTFSNVFYLSDTDLDINDINDIQRKIQEFGLTDTEFDTDAADAADFVVAMLHKFGKVPQLSYFGVYEI